MRRLLENRTVRGLALVALAALVVVAFSLEPVLATTGALLQIAFFLAVAFFLFLVWRERRGDLEAWSEHNRRVFYGAVGLAVVDVGAAIGLRPSRLDVLAFVLVLGASAVAIVRVWRAEHTYRA